MDPEGNRPPRNRLLARLVSAHRIIAGVLLNTVLLFVVLNLVFWVSYAWRDRQLHASPFQKHPKEWLAVSHPGWSPGDLKQLWDEHITKVLSYGDYVMFQETPARGRFVNVSPGGFRLSRQQGPWPPSPTNFNVFVLGGSTMFGTGVPDDQTVSSYLQTALTRGLNTNVCVYNFGTGFYYSTQERFRFERLLASGFIPNAVIFVDGLNDFIQAEDTPALRERFIEAFDVANKKKNLISSVIQELPVARFARSIRFRLHPPVRPEPGLLPARASRVIETYRQNKLAIEALCAIHNIAPVFVWQPVPRFKYDLKFFPWYQSEPNHIHDLHVSGFEQMEALFQQKALGTNFLWCADLQAGETECVYVDIHHYTARFSERLADAISRMAVEQGLLNVSRSVRGAAQ